jgi:HEAT repeat protein
MNDSRNVADGPARRREAALAGHRGDEAAARAALQDEDPTVRATAVAAVARAGSITADDLDAALVDPAPEVRRRACEVAAAHRMNAPAVQRLLTDDDASVVEVAAWALGELEDRDAVATLAQVATSHDDALAREAAVAALGAIGDVNGLPAILAATQDKPVIRRRAVLALAPFEGPDVDAALERALNDRDWQVREAAELLTRE